MADAQFERHLAALAGDEVTTSGLRFLSDLSREQQARLRAAWPELPAASRRRVIVELAELAELSVELDYRRVFEVALDDPDPDVSAAAIDGLWEDESPALLRRLADRLPGETAEPVRLALLRALGRFALLAATGALDEAWGERLYALLLGPAGAADAAPEERRRALEAVAVFAGRPEVEQLIAAAADAPEVATRASALYAMGRNLDPRWLEPVLAALASPEPSLRFEAARASGELGSQRAVPALLELLEDRDREAQLAAVGALGKIGGRAAGTALRRLLRSDDEALREAADEALDELNFAADPLSVP